MISERAAVNRCKPLKITLRTQAKDKDREIDHDTHRERARGEKVCVMPTHTKKKKLMRKSSVYQ